MEFGVGREDLGVMWGFWMGGVSGGLVGCSHA